MAVRVRNQVLSNSCLHHDHDFHQIVIAHRGGAEFEVSGRSGQVDPSHGCLVPGNDVHFYQGIGENSHLILDIPFENVFVNTQSLFEKPLYFELDTGLKYLLSYMHKETETWQYYPEAAEGVITSFLSTLHHRRLGHECRQYVAQQRLDMIAIDEYIKHHIHESLPTSRLASFSNVSTGHFHELFRQMNNKTPGQYLFEMRMNYARQLLLTTHLPLITIAEKVGFSSQSSLTHAFRRCYHMTPGQLRRDKQ